MCMHASGVVGLSRWNWDGEDVVFDTIVPSARPVVGGRRSYKIDVREFLVTERNAVIRATLETAVRAHLSSTEGGYEHFTARTAGAFDYRAQVIAQWVGKHIRYAPKRGRDPWQFPDETLTIGAGDCEDRAFLIASLLLASGISGYHVRVALGQVRSAKGRSYDHAWVMYKSEAGRWTLIEPLRLAVAPGRGRKAAGVRLRGQRQRELPPGFRPHVHAVEYVPHYLWNDAHLWRVPSPGAPAEFRHSVGRAWRRMNPKFAGGVHQSILHKALADIAPPDLLHYLDSRFSPAVLGLLGPVVDASDRGTYNPLDHFDNGCIEQSWDLVNRRLGAFAANHKDYLSFAQAVHGIADFYAHSSYLHFAGVSVPSPGSEPHAKPFDPKHPLANLNDEPDYGPTPPGWPSFDLTSDRFSVNSRLWTKGKQMAAAQWKGRILTGRYGQVGDSRGDLIDRWFIEGPAVLPTQFVTAERGALPHHIEIAVDGPSLDPHHRLYAGAVYATQYRYRFNTAAVHIRQAYLDNAS
jgi:hypothetical protein